jgi:zinc transport system substrate-binding protein
MKGIYRWLATAVWLACAAGCKPAPQVNEIAVTIEPQRYFAEKIGGDKFSIFTVVPGGQSPEVYDPTPRQMLHISRCRAYLRIGYIGFEQVWMRNIQDNNPHLQVFDLSAGFTPIAETGEHGGHHHPGGFDPHIWSSMEGARTIAKNTLEAFLSLDPGNEAFYRNNYAALTEEIAATETFIRRKLEPLTRRAFIIYHPALTYFAEEFDLEQLCIETDGKEPSPAQLKELTDTAREHQVEVVFVQQEFDRRNAERIAAATGCRLVDIRLLDYDWKKEMTNLANALAGE